MAARRHLWKPSTQKLAFFLLSSGFIWAVMTLPHLTTWNREEVLFQTSGGLPGHRQGEPFQSPGGLPGHRQGEPFQSPGAVPGTLIPAQDKCELPPLDGFPHCEAKLKWMKDGWRSDSCYRNHGVDGSACSFVVYLSEVENWCPRLPARPKTLLTGDDWDSRGEQADVRTTLQELYGMMSGREELRWMMLRIEHMEESWVSAVRSLADKQNLARRQRKKVLLHLGLQSSLGMADEAFSGGALGELVQWSDLIATLHLLGHDITISASKGELREAMMGGGTGKSSCPARGGNAVDLIYIDIVGLGEFRDILGTSWVQYRCAMRVLDSFGTEPAFNHAGYARSNGLEMAWGMWELNPQQFYTMFPHTPDNSFLGFVVELQPNAGDAGHFGGIEKWNQAVVYGKVDDFWKDKKKYLDVIHRYVEVHGTVHGTSHAHVPDYVKNHGLLNGLDLQILLRESKLFVGLSFPYEGPAPLEAIANGCAFLNPKFKIPKSFLGKPTLREITSQNPYAEVYIGKPHVWTVDMENSAEVERAVLSILNQKIEPYMPYEFTPEGMLQRVNAFIENQDFCRGAPTWPPLSALRVKMADPGRSCVQACQEARLICEPSFFRHLNNVKDLARFGVRCQTTQSSADTVVPAFSEAHRHCVFQSDQLLFSCAGAHASLKRACPCRDYMKGQVALCKDCL